MVVVPLKSAVGKVMAKVGKAAPPEPTTESTGEHRVQVRFAAERPSFAEPLTESVFRIFANWGEGMRH